MQVGNNILMEGKMEGEVLFAIFLCIASFISGRLQVSGKRANQDVGGLMLASVIVAFCVIYLPVYGRDWLWVGLPILVASACGWLGKDLVKPVLRRKVRPQVGRVVGPWKTNKKDEEDHSDIGIGS